MRRFNTSLTGIFFVLMITILIFQHVNCRSQSNRSSEIPDDKSKITAADYARAEKLLPANVGKLVQNELVVPHWIGESDEFWYKRELEEGWDFVLVDAATGKKQTAFDHEAVATALSHELGEKVFPQKLAFDWFEFSSDRKAIYFSLGQVDYRIMLDKVICVRTPQPDPNLLFSPDKKSAFFTKDGNIFLQDMATGSQRALTNDGEHNFGYGIYYDNWKASFVARERQWAPHPPMECFWSPDSQKIIVTRLDQRHIKPYPIVETVPEDGTLRPVLHPIRIPLAGEKPAIVEWYCFDINTKSKRRLELPYDKLFHVHQDMLAIRNHWFSSDNSHLYAVAFGDNLKGAYLFDIDLASGQVRTVIEEHIFPRTDLNSTSYNPPNVHVVGDCSEVIWFSQCSGWGHLYLYDGQSGKLKNAITQGEWLVRDLIHIDEPNWRIYFTGSGREGGNPYYRYLYRVNFDGSDLTLLSPEPHDHILAGLWNDILTLDGSVGYQVVSPSGRYVVYNYAAIDHLTKSVIRSTEEATLMATFETCNAESLFALGVKGPEEFVVKADDGKTDLYGVLYKPSHFNPEKRYPIIDAQYASPLTAVAPRNFFQAMIPPLVPQYPAAVAELGFIVMVIDARGTTYRSKEFSHYSYERLNTIGLEDHVAAIRQLGERYSYIDVERVGIYGHSYGGYTVIRAMLEFPEFFKVGIAGAGPALLHGLYQDYHWKAYHGSPRYADGSEWKTSPTEMPANWDNLDARKQAEKLQGKLMMLIGELDENVFIGSITQFIAALIKANKDFDLIYLPNTNHYFTNHPYVVRRHWDYFVRHLLLAEPPEYRLSQ